VKAPLVFEPNRGQAPGNVRYLLRGGGFEGEFLNDGFRLTLPASEKTPSQVRMRLVGSRTDASIEGGGAFEGHINYLMGNDPARWLRGLPGYAQVRYSRIYSGTDLVFYGNGGALEHDFELQPGADPKRIAFQLDGAQSVTLDEDGDLRIGLAGGAITFERPIAYQTVAGSRHNVDAAYSVDKDGTVHFQLGSYDRTEKLVIDPVLTFATYLDAFSDTVSSVATDAAGNTYITGLTFNTTYPVTSGGFEQKCTACANNAAAVFVTKLNANGTAQVYSTFLGGSQYNQPSALAVDASGNAIVAGYTESSDFPLKNPISAGTPSYTDGFVTSLAPDGASLNFSSRLGGTSSQGTSASTFAAGVAVDASGNVFVAGTTQSSYLPVTAGALDAGTPSYGTDSYVFLTKLQQSGNLVYSALLGDIGMASDCCYVTGVAVDSAENAYVAGTVGVTIASYATPTPITPWPITAGAYQSEMISPGDTAPFAAKVSADGSTLLYSTLVTTGETRGMALTSENQVILVGTPNYNYPVTSDAYSSTVNTSFINKLSADGTQLLYSSFFGGQVSFEATTPSAVDLDGQGNIWLAGSTKDSTFPLVNPLVAQLPYSSLGAVTSFLSEFDSTGTQLKFSTFMGDLSGSGLQIALDSTGKVHAAGTTTTPINTTAGAFIGTVTAPPSDVEYTYPYAALIDPNTSGATLCIGAAASAGISFGYLLPQTTLTQNVQVSNCGNATLTISSISSSNAAFTVPAGSNSCTGSIAVGGSCAVSVEFAPMAVQAYSGQLTFTSNASIPSTSIQLSGSGGEPVAGFGPRGVTQFLEFSPMLVGQTSPAELIMLYNNGLVPLTIYLSQIAVTSGFALAPGGNCPGSLPANQSCWISVVFAPTAAGTFNGTLSVSSNDPVHPTISTSLTGTGFASYPIATVTALLNPSYPINSGTTPITMSVDGTNFFPNSVVYINGVAQTTTYQNGTFLTVTFNPSLLNAVESIPVTVVNPTPGGGTSAPYPLIEYLSIPLTASALTVDPVGGLLYAAIPSSATQNPNTVIPINPATGATMTPIAVASGPGALAVSGDGSELYVASTGVLQRINLKTLAIERTFNLPVDSAFGQTYVHEMQVVPSSPQSIVVELFANVDPEEDGAALYNDSGLVNWLPGVSATKNQLEMDSFTFTSPTAIYGLPEGNAFFAELQVGSTGLSVISPAGFSCCDESTGSILASDGTLLYTNSGEVWNPTTQKLLGTYIESSGNQLFYTASVVPDTANGHTYFLDGDAGYSNFQSLDIDVYDQASYALLGTVPFMSIYSPDATDLVRWGSNGFAFRSVDITGSEPSANQIVIVTSNLVAPSSGAPIPILSSVSPSPVVAGGPAFTLQLTGVGFTNASTVLIDGNARTTTYISGTSLTAQVLASDIATTGQLDVQVTTPAPGGGTSNYVTVFIEAPPLTTPTVTVTPSATGITTAQALTVTVAISAGSGKAIPTGSVTLSGGGYTSSATSLSNGSATINIPAGSLAIGADTLSAIYTPDSASSTTYNTAGGATSVTVTAPAKTTPTVTAAPSASSITTAQSLSVSVTVSGGSGNPTPTGSVNLAGGGYTSAAVSLAGGGATITIPAGSLAAGTDALNVAYTPDSNSAATYNSANDSTSVTVTAPAKTTPTVTATPSASSITTAQSLAVSVTLSGGSGNPTPTGSVVLSGGGYTSAVASLSGGSVTVTVPAGSLATGTDTLTVAYTPDSGSAATYNGGTGSTSVTVMAPVKSASTVTVTPASSTITNEQTDTVSIAVGGASGQPTPTGTVTLTSGAYSAQQTLANGAANITVPAGALSSGANTLTATYSGDGTFAGSSGNASVTVTQVVISAPAPAAVSPGGSTTSNVTLSAGSTYSGTMNMSCTLVSSPTNAQSLPTCSLSPASVTIATGGNGASVLTVQTTAASNTALLRPTRVRLLGLGGGGTILAGLLLLGIPARRRRWMAMIVLLWAVVAAGAIGCGGGGESNSGSGGSSIPATTAGTYTFKVTGTDSSNQAVTIATSISMTVQ
jgi:hypothetical protein